MNFNFSEVSLPSNISYLKPYTIYDNVVIDKIDTKEGTSSKGKAWKNMTITFKCEEGIHNESIFWITDNSDFERNTYKKNDGSEGVLPSNWETTRDTMAAIGLTFAPDIFPKLQAASTKAKSFDDIANAYIKMIDSVKGKVSTKMKLVGKNSNGKVYAALPKCIGIAQATTEKAAAEHGVNLNDYYTWLICPFGDNLKFTNYELQQKAKLEKAKPTSMDSINAGIDSASDTEIDDFDKLLL